MRKSKAKIDSSVKVAIITTIGAVVVAIISTIFSPAILKLLENKVIPSPTIITSADNQSDTAPIFDLMTASPNSFHSLGNATFNLVSVENGKALQVTSFWDEMVYIDQELPNNFTATVRFQVLDSENEFIIGIGDGGDWRYTYAVSMTWYDISLDKRNTSEKMFERLFNAHDPKYWVEKGELFEIQFQRKDKSLIFILNDSKVIELNRSIDSEISQYNYLFVNSEGNNEPGTIIIDKLVITN